MTDEYTFSLPQDKCFHIAERFLTDYSIPVVRHSDFELHFIENGSGLKRNIGDSSEYTDNYDLIIIHNDKLNYSWEQGYCQAKMLREVVIWFSDDFVSPSLLNMPDFRHLKKMLNMAGQGICFPLSAIMKVYSQIDNLPSEETAFGQYVKILKLLHDLSDCDGMRALSNSSVPAAKDDKDDPRIRKVKGFVQEHYLDQVSLPQLAKMANMTSVSFSRFFKQQTGKNISDYIIDTRLNKAAEMLLESAKPISDICFDSGFNNLSNFNRIFKKKKGTTPKMFRSHYRKDKYTF